MSKSYALITGASSGIGRALAYIFAADGVSLILVARNTAELEKVQADIIDIHNVDVVVRPLDLTLSGAVDKLYNWTTEQKYQVDFLVNNAGFGDRNTVAGADLKRLQGMINLNVESLVVLSKLYSTDMVDRKQGNIINVASIAAFVPGPGMAVYYASKAFVLSFSQALDAELRPSGVIVTAVCPGPTRSGFATAAGAEKTRLFSGDTLATSEEVAAFSYRAMRNGEVVAIHGARYRFLSHFVSLIPRKWLISIVRRIQ